VHRQDQQTLAAAAPGQLKFGVSDRFYAAVRRRVDHYFLGTGRKPRDCPQMYLKTALIFGWFAASYGLLVFLVEPSHESATQCAVTSSRASPPIRGDHPLLKSRGFMFRERAGPI
jgi:hypothetical protein